MLLAEHAKELLGLKRGWKFTAAICLPRNSNVIKSIQITLKHKNPLGGDDFATTQFTPDEHEQWCCLWEVRTGKCRECEGEGREWVGWSAAAGSRYRPCVKCQATGKAIATEARK